MTITRYLKKILKRTVFETKEILVFEYDRDKQGDGKIDPEVREYNEYCEMDSPLRKRLLPFPLINPLYYRFKHPDSKLMCLFKEGDIIAWGWIQSCESLHKKNSSYFDKNGLLLGPYWTNPAYRGQGLYGRLLQHSIAVIDKNRPIVICTRTENTASITGMKKAGFRFAGSYSVLTILFFFVKFSPVKKTAIQQ
ncbi:MAG TPA: GNAT family N-acetyltransferase [bacterium]|mgnify:CR=1 FL=1|nr:GNAT family N-acetyltransferase [bacterium]HPN44171.1 GNAT family N-acetyltransferase [bacterium]